MAVGEVAGEASGDGEGAAVPVGDGAGVAVGIGSVLIYSLPIERIFVAAALSSVSNDLNVLSV